MENSWPPGVIPLTEKEFRTLKEKADAWDEWMESDKQTLDMLADKHHAVRTILYDFCDYYGTETCKESVCEIDPNGWEGCLARQILEILEAEE